MGLKFRQAFLEIEASRGKKRYVLNPNRPNFFDELYVDFTWEKASAGYRYTLFLHPKENLSVLDLGVQFDGVPNGPEARFFANGYQSWSESRPVPFSASIPPLRTPAKPFMGYYGDEHIGGIPHAKGHLHSWTYTYLTDRATKTWFLGSLNEQTGFTLFLLDQPAGVLTVRKDMSGLRLEHSFPGLDFWVGEGRVPELFDAWVEYAIPDKQQAKRPVRPLGWTSWYRYFTQISEAVILKNAAAIAASGLPFGYCQIDDGWQTAVGDWRSVKPAFPGGMGQLATQIRAYGLTPGLWLAPFVAGAKSDLARRHLDWLLKDSRGRPLRAGWNPMWGGWFFALDFYHPGVQDYLSGVFHIILEQWGYELVKLDFLFAACLAPPPGKTRGQVMWDAMAFLRRLTGDRQLLACGVPLGAAFGQADICRVGGDVHMSWEHRLLGWLRHRERVSTRSALRSVLGRWQLNGRAFWSDPDVFILRREGQRLTPVQQHTLLTVNTLLGSVLFTSDDAGAYTAEHRSELEKALTWQGSVVLSVEEPVTDVYVLEFQRDGHRYTAYCNLQHSTVRLPGTKNGRIDIQPFETIILEDKATPVISSS
ncbi:MAG: alpha-galactosidase [Saprospirales bacterium]|nr:alpha-galactosidase [Saprospirales bacterium]MBK8921053.1 alpha-galactosidase [Saprospirales bacterium]